ncbi:lipopolysaccharide assembly protein LapB [Bacteriovorax sp. Seq25_V]|uniref:tetratricopeptide repeat protein n=1 Tax=Bacteriovorax sp. Seq25_V TaxID=1201288 RepID=UPI00038A2A8B|nr:tetratricopeptide repeat protein [Bacteriovorax sp. Seq25_V]EQC44658.1 tetratricopeptide repeat protein [Bacteriovorax sp. Seq25_V]
MKNIFIIITLGFLVSCASNNVEKNKKADLYFSHGTQKLIEQDYTEALKNLLEAQKLDPSNTKIINNLAMAYYFKGKPDIAMKMLKESLELDEKNSDARNNIASIYFTENKLDLAQKEYEKILGDLLYQHTYRVQYNLALIEFKKGNRTKGLSYLEQAVGNRADYCPASYLLANEYRRLGQKAKSLETYKIATRENCAKNPQAFYEWGQLLSELGRDDEAREKFNYIIDKFPKSKYFTLALESKNNIKKSRILSVNKVEKIDSFESSEF